MFRSRVTVLTLTATALAAGIAASGAALGSAVAATRVQPTAAQHRPAPLGPPPGHRLLATYRVTTGSQVYECLPDAAGATWRARPVAVLVGHRGQPVGTHDSVSAQGSPLVPQWSLIGDGSRVAGRLAPGGSFPAPDPSRAIAALRLDVVQNSGVGRLAAADVIQRDLVRGGVGPAGACDPATAAPVVRPYAARYTFWAPDS